MDSLIITLDGPAGSGKSTVARELAASLDLEFLDTGAMYRGLTAMCLDANIDPILEVQRTIQFTKNIELHFDWQSSPPDLYGNGLNITKRLRQADVAAAVSPLSAIKEIRDILVTLQQKIGSIHPRLVTEGRDQGSVVFPNAQFKFYLDASPEVRAKRRADQLRKAGRTNVDESAILNAIADRDHRDSTRTNGPLICPKNAIRIDTSDMTLQEVIDSLVLQVSNAMENEN